MTRPPAPDNPPRPIGQAVTLEALLEAYDAFLFDAYGVLVDREGALPGAVDLLARLQSDSKAVYVVTNSAARLPTHAARRYQAFGLPLGPEQILTAGSLIAPYFSAHGLIGSRCAVLGPPDTFVYVAEAGATPVPATEPFDVLLVGDQVGFPFLDHLDAALTHLIHRLDRDAPCPLVLPNPDLIYPRGNGFGITSGSLAAMIEGALIQRYPGRKETRFHVLGKPEPALIEAALKRAGTRHALLFGDQRATDIRAARAAGIDSVLILGGVSGAHPSQEPCEDEPTFLLQNLLG